MDPEELDFWPTDLMVVQWRSVEVADDDRTITVHFGIDYDESELAPRLTAELSDEALVLRLQLIPIATNGGGIITRWSTSSDTRDRTAAVALAEPLGGRPIVDAWKPPPPPPSVLHSIVVDAAVESVAANRTLYVDSIDVYDEFMSVNYRLRPGERHDDEEAVHLMWELEVEDDLGTDYDVPGGAYGGDDQLIEGDLDVRPAIPPTARSLTLTVSDVSDAGDLIERGRISAVPSA